VLDNLKKWVYKKSKRFELMIPPA